MVDDIIVKFDLDLYPVVFSGKTDSHNITEILLKVVLNAIKPPTPKIKYVIFCSCCFCPQETEVS
jgi:hypothetical protein